MFILPKIRFSSVGSCRSSQWRAKGDLLVSVETMKMETTIRAERDALVKQTHVKPGAVVAAKDMLVEHRLMSHG